MQTRLQSLIETCVNTGIGYTVSVIANWLVLPAFGYAVSLADSALIGVVFTFIAIARGYLVRRLFNWIHHR